MRRMAVIGIVAGLGTMSCGEAPPTDNAAQAIPQIVAQVQACARHNAGPAADGDEQFQCATPIFAVSDLQASLTYYEQTLGFRTQWQWGEPATFAATRRGHVELFFCEGCQGSPGTFVTVFVKDVDALFAEYTRSGAKILAPPTDEEWGLREMWVQDPDGHVLRLGHSTE